MIELENTKTPTFRVVIKIKYYYPRNHGIKRNIHQYLSLYSKRFMMHSYGDLIKYKEVYGVLPYPH